MTLSKSATTTQPQSLTCSFTVPGRHLSTVYITVAPNSDPTRSGSRILFPEEQPSAFIDFPTCNATITTPEDTGYAAMYGWIQFVRETPLDPANINPSIHKWQHDPIPITAGVDTPFIWFGARPELFDAPFRVNRTDMEWTCRSFLTYLPDCVMERLVHPILVVEWGFWIRGGEVRIMPLRMVDVGEAWETQRGLLEEMFPNWRFGVKEKEVVVSEMGGSNE